MTLDEINSLDHQQLDEAVCKLIGELGVKHAMATSDGGKSLCASTEMGEWYWKSPADLERWLADEKSHGRNLEYEIKPYVRYRRYSTDIKLAMTLMERLPEMVVAHRPSRWIVSCTKPSLGSSWVKSLDDLPSLVCRAFLWEMANTASEPRKDCLSRFMTGRQGDVACDHLPCRCLNCGIELYGVGEYTSINAEKGEHKTCLSYGVEPR